MARDWRKARQAKGEDKHSELLEFIEGNKDADEVIVLTKSRKGNGNYELSHFIKNNADLFEVIGMLETLKIREGERGCPTCKPAARTKFSAVDVGSP